MSTKNKKYKIIILIKSLKTIALASICKSKLVILEFPKINFLRE